MSADTTHGHVSRGTYLAGFLFSVVLTAVPFWLVMTHAVSDPRVLAAVLIGSAFVQILVHTVCFLHVNPQSEGGWTLMAYVFTAVLVLIAVSGSLWIMHHINSNMARSEMELDSSL